MHFTHMSVIHILKAMGPRNTLVESRNIDPFFILVFWKVSTVVQLDWLCSDVLLHCFFRQQNFLLLFCYWMVIFVVVLLSDGDFCWCGWLWVATTSQWITRARSFVFIC